MADYLVQEDGTSKFVLEDASGDILLETSTSSGVSPSFIASATVVYPPTLTASGGGTAGLHISQRF